MDFTEVGCLFRDLDTKLNALFSDLAGGQEPSNHVVSDVARVRVWESAEVGHKSLYTVADRGKTKETQVLLYLFLG